MHQERRPKDVPIYLGATGMKMMELTGEIADGAVLNYLVSPELQRHRHGAPRPSARPKPADRSTTSTAPSSWCARSTRTGAGPSTTPACSSPSTSGQQPHIMKASGVPGLAARRDRRGADLAGHPRPGRRRLEAGARRHRADDHRLGHRRTSAGPRSPSTSTPGCDLPDPLPARRRRPRHDRRLRHRMTAPIIRVEANPMRHQLEPVPDPRSSESAGGTGSAPDLEPMAFHRRLPGYAPTPLIDATGLAARARRGPPARQGRVEPAGAAGVQDAGRVVGLVPGPGRRGRAGHGAPLGEWSTIDELAGLLEPLRPLDLATATDGNHGRAVARFARLVGLGARIFVPDGTSRGPHRRHRVRGRAVRGRRRHLRRRRRPGRPRGERRAACLVISDTSWPGYEAVPRWVIDGYATIFAEIDEQLAAVGPAARPTWCSSRSASAPSPPPPPSGSAGRGSTSRCSSGSSPTPPTA